MRSEQMDEWDVHEQASDDQDDEIVERGVGSAVDAESNPPIGERENAAQMLLERSRRLLDQMHADDREEAIDLHERIETAIAARDANAVGDALRSLEDLLFFIEGHV